MGGNQAVAKLSLTEVSVRFASKGIAIGAPVAVGECGHDQLARERAT